MTSAPEKRYCWTCKRSIAPAWWQRHMASVGHVRRALGDPPPFVHPKTRKGTNALIDDEPDEPDEADEPDTRVQCGGCSRRITPGREYHRDDGKAYHNGCVPLATTRPRNRPQAPQVDPQQAGKLVAGVGASRWAREGHRMPSGSDATKEGELLRRHRPEARRAVRVPARRTASHRRNCNKTPGASVAPERKKEKPMIKVDTERYGHETTSAYCQAAFDVVVAQTGLTDPDFETWQNLMEDVRHSSYLQGLQDGLNGNVNLYQLQQAEGPRRHDHVGHPILDGRPNTTHQLAAAAAADPDGHTPNACSVCGAPTDPQTDEMMLAGYFDSNEHMTNRKTHVHCGLFGYPKPPEEDADPAETTEAAIRAADKALGSEGLKDLKRLG